MAFQKVMIWLNAAIFILFGVGYLIAPNTFAALVDMHFDKPNALIDARALYGGMLVGIGVWYAYCAQETSRMRYGLISALLIALGLLIGRITGVLVAGEVNTVNLFYIGIESFVVVLLMMAVYQARGRVPGNHRSLT